MNETDRRRRVSRRRQFQFGLFTVIVAALLVLAGMEGLVRWARPYYTPETLRWESLLYEPAVLARHQVVPNQHHEELGYSVNAQGYRGPDFRKDKKPGVLRIMFLGGSMVWTAGAPKGEDWPTLTGEVLKAGGFEGVEALNAGTPGHASWDSLGRFYAELWTFQPDIVVICHAWNDLKKIKTYEEGVSLFRSLRPYRPSRNPHLYYQNPVDRLLGENSQVYVRLRTRFYAWKHPMSSEGALEPAPLRPDFDPEALEQYRLNMNLIADAVQHTGGRPVFVTQPTLVMPDIPDSDRERIRYQYVGLEHDALSAAFKECRDIVMEIGESRDIAVIDAYASLSGKPDSFRDHVHLTLHGSRELSKIVAEGLAELPEVGSAD